MKFLQGEMPHVATKPRTQLLEEGDTPQKDPSD